MADIESNMADDGSNMADDGSKTGDVGSVAEQTMQYSPEALRCIDMLMQKHNVTKTFAHNIVEIFRKIRINVTDRVELICNDMIVFALNMRAVEDSIVQTTTESVLHHDRVDLYQIYAPEIRTQVCHWNWMVTDFETYVHRVFGVLAEEHAKYKEVFTQVLVDVLTKIYMDERNVGYRLDCICWFATVCRYGKDHIVGIAEAVQQAIMPTQHVIVCKTPTSVVIQLARYCAICKCEQDGIFSCKCQQKEVGDGLYAFAEPIRRCKACGMGYITSSICTACCAGSFINHIAHVRYVELIQDIVGQFRFTSSAFTDPDFLSTTTRRLSVTHASGVEVTVDHEIISGMLEFRMNPQLFTKAMYVANDADGNPVRTYYLTALCRELTQAQATPTYWLVGGKIVSDTVTQKRHDRELATRRLVLEKCRAFGIDVQPDTPITPELIRIRNGHYGFYSQRLQGHCGICGEKIKIKPDAKGYIRHTCPADCEKPTPFTVLRGMRVITLSIPPRLCVRSECWSYVYHGGCCTVCGTSAKVCETSTT
jgi:hypothetical protein